MKIQSKQKIITILVLLLFLLNIRLTAQQVGIGTNTPDSSAILDIQSTNSGLLIPRMTSVQRIAILTPAKGLMVFDNTTNSFWFYDGLVWGNIATTNVSLDDAYNNGSTGNGRKITANDSAVIINGTDGLYVTGTFGQGTNIEIEGVGTRMYFNPKKGAFRAGQVNGAQWDETNIGEHSIAMGYRNRASGNRSVTFGNQGVASGGSSTALGFKTTANGSASIATGNTTTANGSNASANGKNTTANGFSSTVVGLYNEPIVATETSVSANTPLFIVGNGTNTSLSNALMVRNDGNIGVGTDSPVENLDIDGAIKVGNTTNTNAGAIRWSGTDFEGFNGIEWVSLTYGGNTNWGAIPKQPLNPKQKVIASDGAQNDRFGSSVSISGDYAIIGAYNANIGVNTNQGSAYVFKRTGTSWTEEAKLTASDGALNDVFGYSVSINGDYAIIGAQWDDISGNTHQGSAYVFKRTGTSWLEEAKLIASDGSLNDNFGNSVSVNGDYAIIGANGADIGGNSNQGSAYVFKRTGTSWAEKAKLTASDGALNDRFGNSVSVNGDYAFIGANGADIGGNSNQGSAYVFKRTGTSWLEEAKLIASDGSLNDNFGNSVSVNGDYAIIGANGADIGGNSNQGSAYVFKRTGTSWTEEAKLIASDGALNDIFGYSVYINGDYAIIGAFGVNSSQGSAYVFKRTGTSWAEETKLIANDGEISDYFGFSVAIDGNKILIGAYGSNANGTNAGAVYFSDK